MLWLAWRDSARGKLVVASLCCLSLLGCDNTLDVNFRSGPLDLTLSASSLALPAELRDEQPDGARIVEFPCGPGDICPSSDPVEVTCLASLCNPAPTRIMVPVGDVVDFDQFGEEAGSDAGDSKLLDEVFGRVERIQIREIAYTVPLNTLTVGIGQVDLFWSPEGAATGENLLGVAPAISEGWSGAGQVVLDSTGPATLSDYLIGTSRRVRFFASTEVDLEPGARFPEGDLTGTVVLSITVSGPIVN